jgi:hypothetical protein
MSSQYLVVRFRFAVRAKSLRLVALVALITRAPSWSA